MTVAQLCTNMAKVSDAMNQAVNVGYTIIIQN